MAPTTGPKTNISPIDLEIKAVQSDLFILGPLNPQFSTTRSSVYGAQTPKKKRKKKKRGKKN